ncbi:DUF998 domain-containing protein [Erysipelotrichaceae bacterium OttesenSCG-928-M19]|nr:DUF998 domain-containing protein [Erysipelotrichaceae bacterium OttesenSCG-928-M19]
MELDSKEINLLDEENNETKNVVLVPKEITSKLELNEENKAVLKIDDQKATIEVIDDANSNQNIGLRWFLMPSIIASLIFVCIFNSQKEVPLSGDYSIASYTLILGLISGICCFFYFFIKSKRSKLNIQLKHIYWRNFPTVVASFSIILAFVILYFFKMLDLIFIDLSFDVFTATCLFFLFMCVINYLMIYLSLSINPTMLTNTLILVLIGGVIASMVTNSELHWWQHNLSFLGTDKAHDNWQFNVTLIFSALLMIALIDYLFVIIQATLKKDRRLTILRIMLYLIAINLGAVGLFPNSDILEVKQVHNDIANCLVLLVIGLIIALRWLLPNISKSFLRLSYFVGIGLITSYIFFEVIGYFSLTAFELIAFILAFSWILLLLQYLQSLAKKSEQSFIITIKSLD